VGPGSSSRRWAGRQFAVAAPAAHEVCISAVRLRMDAKLWRAGLSICVNQLRRCSWSAAATSGIRMQCTPSTMPRRCRPGWGEVVRMGFLHLEVGGLARRLNIADEREIPGHLERM
jgi:hypothetical protein